MKWRNAGFSQVVIAIPISLEAGDFHSDGSEPTPKITTRTPDANDKN